MFRHLWGLLLAEATARAAWPNGPFVTSGRAMTDASGTTVTYVGVNWPAAADTMLPDGLQYQSVSSIVSKIKSLDMNVVRLTYAIQMVDEIEGNGGDDIPIQTAFTTALGQENGTAVYNQVVANNPSFGANTTRLQVFDAVANECAKQEIYIHLDNHVSKAGWCCTPIDGNSWWGDIYFSTANWTRGLSYMADHGKQWANLMSMSLRNELRQPFLDENLFAQSYNWQDWYKYTKQGADAIHKANPDVLIFLSGLDSDTSLNPVVQGTDLTPGTAKFNRDEFQAYSNKLVLELHNYANILGGSGVNNCTALQDDLFNDGFQSLSDDAPNQFPLVMTEFGFVQDATTWNETFARCLESYIPAQGAGWTIWVIAGSYYVREGKQDYDESWGLLTHDWSDWRSPEHINGGLIPMIKASLHGKGFGNSSGNNSSGTGNEESEALLRYEGGMRLTVLVTFVFASSCLILWL
ncbi:glycoside hydrolase superfamily [Pseudomassariella vexata]|uniref:Glycoside hydrolase superfamily n=1 Tax=Pseudomassariella vexata TaxID=1141098 RepID=A0A1Y2D6Q1_9PEZI|nr:glycoside hydrolase superfamily [Pseudomassariella vexata]ORY54952.1 glycoside hydrolase superfamily [Pseudomassariella vexata]